MVKKTKDSGIPSYRMSGVGGCALLLGAIRLNYSLAPFSDKTLKIFRESRRHEDWIIEDLRDMGWDIHRATGPCPTCRSGIREGLHVEIHHGTYVLVGHMDGLVLRPGKHVRSPLEVKALGFFSFQKLVKDGIQAFFAANPSYSYQWSSYMFACGANSWPGMYAVKCRDDGRLELYDIEEPPVTLGEVLGRVSFIEYMASKGELPLPDRGGYHCNDCPARHICTKPWEIGKKEVVDKAVPGDDLIAAASMFREGARLLREGKALDQASRDVFRAHLRSTGKSAAEIEELELTLSTRSRRSYPEKNLLTVLDRETLDRIVKVTPYEQLDIADKRKAGGE